MKNRLGISFFFLLILLHCSLIYAAPPNAGDIAPALRVMSGDGKMLTLEQLRGKVVVIFYNSKDTINHDFELRKLLNKYYDNQSGDKKTKVFKLAIIDCSSAFFPIDYIWKSKLIEASRQKQMDIYGDWSGKVAEAYSFNPGDSNIVVIDKDGIIRYISRKEITDEKEINAIIALLNQIT